MCCLEVWQHKKTGLDQQHHRVFLESRSARWPLSMSPCSLGCLKHDATLDGKQESGSDQLSLQWRDVDSLHTHGSHTGAHVVDTRKHVIQPQLLPHAHWASHSGLMYVILIWQLGNRWCIVVTSLSFCFCFCLAPRFCTTTGLLLLGVTGGYHTPTHWGQHVVDLGLLWCWVDHPVGISVVFKQRYLVPGDELFQRNKKCNMNTYKWKV